MKSMSQFSIGSLSRIGLLWLFTVVFSLMALGAQAQDEESPEKDTRPVRKTFESVWLMENQTVMVPIKGTFEMDIQHRFGTVDNGYDDFFGLYAPSNIRIGFNYVPVDKLQLGFGFTKERKLWDFNAKYALFQQAREGGWPVSVTYLVYAAVDSRQKDNFLESTDRWSYFHQLMIARKLSDNFSLQAGLSISHFNFQEQIPSEADPNITEKMNNDHLGLSFLGRYKIGSTASIIAGYDLPLTDHDINNPEPNLSFGIELVSSSHAFQIFLSNYQSIVPQLNNMFNQNALGDGQLLIGFNITRLWN